MNTFIALITIALVTVTVCSSPIDHRQDYKPVEHYVQRIPAPVKGNRPAVKGPPPEEPLYFNVRKGEYVCGNRICKLTPGVVPKGCNGICQYPLGGPLR